MKIITRTFRLFVATSILSCCWLSTYSQISTPAPSPFGSFTQMVGLAEIAMEYSRPGVKGRMIFGDSEDHLLKYGVLWRAGANAATRISFSEDVKINGKDIPEGEYAVYMTPGADEWTVFLYDDLSTIVNDESYDQEKEVAKFAVKPEALTNNVESLTFLIGNITSNPATWDMYWEKTRISLNIETEVDGQVMEMISEAMENPYSRVAGLFAQSAGYYYNNDKDMSKALEWINKAIEYNPSMFRYDTKANIQAKLKDYKGAIKSIEAAHKAGASASGGTLTFYESTFKSQLDEKAEGFKKM